VMGSRELRDRSVDPCVPAAHETVKESRIRSVVILRKRRIVSPNKNRENPQRRADALARDPNLPHLTMTDSLPQEDERFSEPLSDRCVDRGLGTQKHKWRLK